MGCVEDEVDCGTSDGVPDFGFWLSSALTPGALHADARVADSSTAVREVLKDTTQPVCLLTV